MQFCSPVSTASTESPIEKKRKKRRRRGREGCVKTYQSVRVGLEVREHVKIQRYNALNQYKFNKRTESSDGSKHTKVKCWLHQVNSPIHLHNELIFKVKVLKCEFGLDPLAPADQKKNIQGEAMKLNISFYTLASENVHIHDAPILWCLNVDGDCYKTVADWKIIVISMYLSVIGSIIVFLFSCLLAGHTLFLFLFFLKGQATH